MHVNLECYVSNYAYTCACVSVALRACVRWCVGVCMLSLLFLFLFFFSPPLPFFFLLFIFYFFFPFFPFFPGGFFFLFFLPFFPLSSFFSLFPPRSFSFFLPLLFYCRCRGAELVKGRSRSRGVVNCGSGRLVDFLIYTE